MLIKSLHLKNILSFKDTKLDLQPLERAHWRQRVGQVEPDRRDRAATGGAGRSGRVPAAQRADGGLGLEGPDWEETPDFQLAEIHEIYGSEIPGNPFCTICNSGIVVSYDRVHS